MAENFERPRAKALTNEDLSRIEGEIKRLDVEMRKMAESGIRLRQDVNTLSPVIFSLVEKMDTMVSRMGELAAQMVGFKVRCGDCADTIKQHSDELRAGDRIGIKSVIMLLGAVGALAATIGGAFVAFLK